MGWNYRWRTSPGYSASTTRPDTLGTTTPSPRRSSRRPSLLQEVELGLSVCLVRPPVPLNKTKHQKTTQKAEKQLCECRESHSLMPTQYITYHQWGWVPEIKSTALWLLGLWHQEPEKKPYSKSPNSPRADTQHQSHLAYQTLTNIHRHQYYFFTSSLIIGSHLGCWNWVYHTRAN